MFSEQMFRWLSALHNLIYLPPELKGRGLQRRCLADTAALAHCRQKTSNGPGSLAPRCDKVTERCVQPRASHAQPLSGVEKAGRREVPALSATDAARRGTACSYPARAVWAQCVQVFSTRQHHYLLHCRRASAEKLLRAERTAFQCGEHRAI